MIQYCCIIISCDYLKISEDSKILHHTQSKKLLILFQISFASFVALGGFCIIPTSQMTAYWNIGIRRVVIDSCSIQYYRIGKKIIWITLKYRQIALRVIEKNSFIYFFLSFVRKRGSHLGQSFSIFK